MSNEMYEFDVTANDTTDEDAIETGGLRFPTIIFKKGDPTRRPTKGQSDPGIGWRGGFFISDEDITEDLTAAGWQASSFISREGKEVSGWYTPTITIQHIARRQEWTVTKDGQTLHFPWTSSKEAEKAGKMAGHQQSVVLVRGLEKFGPFCLSLSGHTQKAFNGNSEYAQTGCLSSFKRTVIAAANAKSAEAAPKGVKPQDWPLYAFWLTISASKDEKGDPKFVNVGKGDKTTPIVLPVPVGLPATAKEVDLGRYFVGRARKAAGDETFAMLKSEGWLTAWDKKADAKAEGAGDDTTGAKVTTAQADYAAAAGV